MPQVVHPAVEVDVDQLATVDVPDVVALPAADHQIDSGAGEEAHAITAHVPLGEFEGVLLPGRRHESPARSSHFCHARR